MSKQDLPPSDVDKPFLPDHQGKAKEAFNRSAPGHISAQQGQTGSDGVGDSIKRHAPDMANRPDGEARKLDAAFAKVQVEKEISTARFRNTQRIAKLLQLKQQNNHNKSKGTGFDI